MTVDSSTLALIFPGQGSQYPGMGKELADAYPQARDVFEEASQVLGRPISRLCFEGTEEELRKTSNTQPALYVASAAALAVLRSEGFDGSVVAGHSLGEYSALHAAGAIDFATGLRLVDARGRAMETAAKNRPGAMAAILGLKTEQVLAICREASSEGVVVAANINAPRQTVISGSEEALDRAIVLAREGGAKRAIKLKVSGGFHSPLMAEAVEKLRAKLEEAQISTPRLRFIANASADFLNDPDSIRQSLLNQLTVGVRWSDSVLRIASDNVNRFIEVGPGKVLTALLRRIDRALEGHNFGKPSDLQRLRQAFA